MASAFFASPFEEAAVVSVDRYGDSRPAMWGPGRGNQIRVLGSVGWPHSLGRFWEAFRRYLGLDDSGQMIALAAHGEPIYKGRVRQLATTIDGQTRLDTGFFTGHSYSRKMITAFGPARDRGNEITQQHMDLAASAQAVLEDNYFALLRHVHQRTGMKQLCLAGEVALNYAANGKILEQTPFNALSIAAAPDDGGLALGAALHVCHEVLDQPRRFVMRHPYYGSEFDDAAMLRAIACWQATAHHHSSLDAADAAARVIAEGGTAGWFQGRAEFVARPLGNRCILTDPRRATSPELVTAPYLAILAGRASEWFEVDHPSPFLHLAYPIRPARHELIPAVVLPDGTGRLHTVEESVNPLYWRLLGRVEELTGVPLVKSERLAYTPEEALERFLHSDMDVLVLGSYVLHKAENRLPVGEAGRVRSLTAAAR
jgi:carbamoyltransferase